MKVYHRSLLPLSLPFYGEWSVSQGHNGNYTHKEDWRFAWDFVITDHEGQQYKNKGDNPADYFCYEKSVLSPGTGIVEEVNDDIPDNDIGNVNTINNWGNSIVIKHADHLYSCLSHLKAGSISVKPGDKVMQGQSIAQVGNSGRSPYPHLHMQFQSNPFVGSQTIYYPLSYFILNTGKNYFFKSFEIPEKDNHISNVNLNSLLQNAFNFIPGQKLNMVYTSNGIKKTESWTVNTNAYNLSYLYSETTNSFAYFTNDRYLFNFNHFEGDKNSLLFYFYQGFYQVLQGNYKDISISDELPQNISFKGPLMIIQDFIAPFWLFLKSKYTLNYPDSDNLINESEINLNSKVTKTVMGLKLNEIVSELVINKIGIKTFVFKNGENEIIASIE